MLSSIIADLVLQELARHHRQTRMVKKDGPALLTCAVEKDECAVMVRRAE
jgi:hypothetical protein